MSKVTAVKTNSCQSGIDSPKMTITTVKKLKNILKTHLKKI